MKEPQNITITFDGDPIIELLDTGNEMNPLQSLVFSLASMNLSEEQISEIRAYAKSVQAKGE
ncbi:hypothetical protein VCHA38O209_50260 [Vibrio chagasii]|nr:hypothetical protein VCHA38O209_50260 [Vibrio chagasii]